MAGDNDDRTRHFSQTAHGERSFTAVAGSVKDLDLDRVIADVEVDIGNMEVVRGACQAEIKLIDIGRLIAHLNTAEIVAGILRLAAKGQESGCGRIDR